MEADQEHINPFASPLAEESAPGPGAPSDLHRLEQIRRDHLSREATIKSLGLVSYIAVGFGCLGLVGIVAAMLSEASGLAMESFVGTVELLFLLFIAGFLALTFWVGAGLRRFNPAARIGGIGLSVIWLLLSLPSLNLLTLIISICGLWCLLGEKAKYIFTPDYQQVIAATPHVRYKTSVLTWVVLAVLVIAIGVIGFFSVFTVS